ncbi:hypothetical protein E6H14_08685 [Candidatus Bathyarchaeota archaeon]|nr:MAG: hypothetical protein E6H14_08685 [Candidatus Bathyarchaeota archaeon]
MGDRVIVYNVPTGYQTLATVYKILHVDVNSTLTILTTQGLPFRSDANPHMKIWVLTANGPVETPITTDKAWRQHLQLRLSFLGESNKPDTHLWWTPHDVRSVNHSKLHQQWPHSGVHC